MDRCRKDEATTNNLDCKKALPIPEKNWKNLLGVAIGGLRQLKYCCECGITRAVNLEITEFRSLM